MIRYCHERNGALGFVVSQDGDIQAMTRIGDKLVLWENVDVPLAFPGDEQAAGGQVCTPGPAPLHRPTGIEPRHYRRRPLVVHLTLTRPLAFVSVIEGHAPPWHRSAILGG